MEEAGELRARARNNKRQELERLQEQMLDKAEERAAMFELERKEDSERIERNQTQQYEVRKRVVSCADNNMLICGPWCGGVFCGNDG